MEKILLNFLDNNNYVLRIKKEVNVKDELDNIYGSNVDNAPLRELFKNTKKEFEYVIEIEKDSKIVSKAYNSYFVNNDNELKNEGEVLADLILEQKVIVKEVSISIPPGPPPPDPKPHPCYINPFNPITPMAYAVSPRPPTSPKPKPKIPPQISPQLYAVSPRPPTGSKPKSYNKAVIMYAVISKPTTSLKSPFDEIKKKNKKKEVF